MSGWKEIRRPFRDALIAAFTWNKLANVLAFHCEPHQLYHITSKSEGFENNVDDVIADAVQTGWLEKLAAGALAENPTHTGLKATMPQILEGVKNEGKAYYQDYGELLQTHKDSSQISYRKLADLSDVPRSTIQNWVKGAKPQRRRWQEFIRLVSSLGLTGRQVDDLLVFLLLPPVRELYKISAYEDDRELEEILGEWVGVPGAEKLRVFLCHASADKEAVRSLYRKLLDDGVDPWLDEVNLLPGMEWEKEIIRAVGDSDVILVILSPRALTAEGYIHKEIGAALELAEKRPQGSVFLIPVRLEPCDVPERLAKYQWVNLYEADGYERLLAALQKHAVEIAGRAGRS